jgi:hypothetical protein
MIRKGLILVFFMLLVSLSFVSALSLGVSSKVVVDTVINDADQPLIFDFTITNSGDSADFEIFSFERFSIKPNEFYLDSGDSVTLRVSFSPEDSMKENIGHLSVPVFFREKGSSETLEKQISVKLVDFGKIFDFKAENVNPESDSLTLTFYNVEDISHQNVKIVFSSDFFKDREITTSLDSFEKKIFAVPISNSDFKKLVSGTYYVTASYVVDGRDGLIESPVKLLEKSGIVVSENSKGFIVNTRTINKYNEGNVPTVADVFVSKNIISRFFTTFSVEPTRVERDGIGVNYFWQKELQPDETLTVSSTTNWLFPLLILIGIIIVVYLFNIYLTNNVSVRKRVSFVRTKGGEFALKVTVNVKARKFVEKVVLYDRLPAMAQLYEKFGSSPHKVNKVSGRLQWDVGHLGEGEERTFSYVIYSKMKVIGKFELPSATAMYELEGKLHEARSNRAFFINEPREYKEDGED